MTDLHITPYVCPLPGCVGGLIQTVTGDTDRCLHCSGSGLTDDPMGGADRAPRPPGVMRAPCADCAFRPGSPELENAGVQLPDDEPFFCHQGLPTDSDSAVLGLISEIASRLEDATDDGEYHAVGLIGDLANGRKTVEEVRAELADITFRHV